MVDAFGGSRSTVKPPERGIFQLDHEGECKENAMLFLSCLKANKNDNYHCRDLSAAYLKCRMDKNLMTREDLKDLGFGPEASYKRSLIKEDTKPQKELTGFIAGTNVSPSSTKRGWFY